MLIRLALFALSVVTTLALGQPTRSVPATAPPITVATWNLGWHMDLQLAKDWIGACGQPFAKDSADGLWKPSPSGDKSGWQLRWGRDAKIAWDISVLPPCDVYQANFKIVPVTEASYRKRQLQIASVLKDRVKADILALQEVSGATAVREVLPDGGAGYEICSFDGFKVQRLAIAWRTSLGTAESCEVFRDLSLPDLDPKDQPRPGLALTLNVGGKRLRVLTVHLKSSCVSPLENPTPDGKGQLDGNEANCRVLHAQVPALESWVEQQSRGADAVMILGDFNRNLHHESSLPANAIVRMPGQPTDPFTPATKVRNLWREVNDQAPPASGLSLVQSECRLTTALNSLCTEAKSRPLSKTETSSLAASSALGCRNPLGLDHIATRNLKVEGPALKVALGPLGRTLISTPQHPDPLLALSDHCPLVARVAM